MMVKMVKKYMMLLYFQINTWLYFNNLMKITIFNKVLFGKNRTVDLFKEMLKKAK